MYRFTERPLPLKRKIEGLLCFGLFCGAVYLDVHFVRGLMKPRVSPTLKMPVDTPVDTPKK